MKDFEDDDFGELYADVELQAGSAISSLPVQDQLPQDEELNAQLTGSILGESTQFEKDTDTDDELKIVLNDEDSASAGRNEGGSEGVKIEGDAKMPKTCCVSAYMDHMKGRTSSGLMLEDDGKDVNYSAATARVHVQASSMFPQVGHNFSLPRYRSIFDVNIDSFREKPWRYPGADITDFFNFGLDEERSRQHKYPHSTMFPLQVNKVYQGVEHVNPVQEVRTNGTLQCSDKKPGQLIVKGRAIEVEESVAERQPSMVLRHVSSYDDSNVIQIPLQDCPGQASGAGKEKVGCRLPGIPGTYENGKMDANDIEIAMDGPEESAGTSELPIPERFSVEEIVSKPVDCANNKVQITSSSDDETDHISHYSERIAEPRGRVKVINEGVFEVSQIEQEKLSLSSSLFETDTEPSEYSASVDLEIDRATAKRSPLRSGDESKESFAKDNDDSISGAGMKSTKWRDYSSNRSMIKRETRQNWRIKDSTDQKNYDLDEYVVSPVSHSRGLSDWENSQSGCKQRNVICRDFNHYDRECSSPSYYNSKRGCVDEWLGGNHVQDVHRGSSYRKGHSFLIDDMDPNSRRNWKKRAMINTENYREVRGERDYGSFRESKCSKERISAPHRSTRQFETNFLSYTYKDGSPSRIHTEDNPFNEKYNQAGRFCHHRYEDDFLQDGHGRYVSSKDGEQCSMCKSYSRQFPSRREVTFSGRSERHRRSPPVMDRSWAIEPEGRYLTSRDSERGYFGKSYSTLPGRREMINTGRNERHKKGPLAVDESWVAEPEEGYGNFMDCGLLPHHPFREPHEDDRTLEISRSSKEELYNSRPIRRYGKSLRSKFGNRSDFGFSSVYSKVYDLGDAIAYPHGGIRLERTRYTKQSKVLHLSKSGLTSRHGNNKFQTKEASVFRRRNSTYAVHHKYGNLNDGMFEDDVQAEQYKYTNLKEDSGAFHVNNGFHVDRIQDDQKKTFSRGSVDLYVRDGKPSRRAHKRRNMTHTANPEDNKEKSADTSRSIGQHAESKWIDKFPVTEPNNELDIEEGQVVAEVPIPQKPSPKKKMLDTERNEVDSGVYDKSLLETLAKMEKRRERFKETATRVKEPELQFKIRSSLNDPSLSKNRVMDIVVEEAAVTTFQRPSRKRKWCGS